MIILECVVVKFISGNSGDSGRHKCESLNDTEALDASQLATECVELGTLSWLTTGWG